MGAAIERTITSYAIALLSPEKNAIKALVSDHLGNSEKWSQLELLAYEDGLS